MSTSSELILLQAQVASYPGPYQKGRGPGWYILFAHASNFPCDFLYNFQDTLLSTWAMYGAHVGLDGISNSISILGIN